MQGGGGGTEEGEAGGAPGWEFRPMAQMSIEQPLCAWHCSGLRKRKKKADKDPTLVEKHG